MTERGLDGWTCPTGLRDTPTVVMGHGGGGAMSAELVEQLFLPGHGAERSDLGDAAVVELGGHRVAMSTDSFVVRPMFFPGGSLGELAVNGTVNDVAMAGARPLYLSIAYILEEGTSLDVLRLVATAAGAAAARAGVRLVTGDTKVVDRGCGDGIYVCTTGLGLVLDGVDVRPDRARAGDAVLVSGDVGLHGVAVLSCREGLAFETAVASDTAPLHELVAAMAGTGADLHVLRDPTRGGVAATVNEIARSSGIGVLLEDAAIPVPAAVRDACGLLGLDPLEVANEGKLLAFVPADAADDVLAAMRAHPLGRGACRIGTCVADHRGLVVSRTALGGTRVVGMPVGEQLPRIC